ncbi:MAG: dioxygenase [Acidimicrobiales bacterium]
MEASNDEFESVRRERMDAITNEVLASFSGAEDPRLVEVMQALVRHLHSFICEVALTSEEWSRAIEFLTEVGKMTDDKRQEFILLSDVLGVSMTTVTQNATADPRVTESTVFGPFFHEHAPEISSGDDLSFGAPGAPCYVAVRVSDVDGAPIPGARIDVWGADEEGRYDVQYEGDVNANRAFLHADEEGRACFWTVLPTAYSIPTDGPVGALLKAANRSPMRPAHLHFKIDAPGYSPLITHIFVDGDRYLGMDAVFGVRPSLVEHFHEHVPGEVSPDGREMEVTWWSFERSFTLGRV